MREGWQLRVLVALAAAIPTIAWAVAGGDLISDDWGLAAAVRFNGFWPTFQANASYTGRPVAALVFCLQYGAFGSHPMPYLLVLAAVNAVVAILVLSIALRLLPARVAVLTAIAWAVLPNRGSTRLWIVMLPAVLALALVLAAVLVLVGDRRRPFLAGALFGVGTLAYEAVVVIGATALLVWAWKQGRSWWPKAVIAGALPVASAAWVYFNSPKRGSGAVPFANASQLLHAQIGRGIFGWDPIAVALSIVLVGRVMLAVVRATLPSFRPPSLTDRMILAGTALSVLGALPFVIGGFPFATDGIFDRGNLVADLGTSLIIGASLASILDTPVRLVSQAVVALSLLWMMALNGVDVADYLDAVRDGDRLVAQLDHDLPTIPGGGVLVVPALPNRGGVAMFILGGDLGARLQLDRDIPVAQPIRVALEGEDQVAADEAYRYDRLTRQVTGRGESGRK